MNIEGQARREGGHTPGPLTVHGGTLTYEARGCEYPIAAAWEGVPEFRENAARLAACWNACAGLPDPAAELARLRASNAGLAAALAASIDRLEYCDEKLSTQPADDYDCLSVCAALNVCRAAIAKAERRV